MPRPALPLQVHSVEASTRNGVAVQLTGSRAELETCTVHVMLTAFVTPGAWRRKCL